MPSPKKPRKQADNGPAPKRYPRRKRGAPLYDGKVPDVPSLPLPPYARCPRPDCGRYVAVIVDRDGGELFPHRTPMPASRLCDYPTKVNRGAITFATVVPPASR